MAYTRDIAENLAPFGISGGFSRSDHLMMSLKVIDPCCHGNQKFGILIILTQILPQLRRDTVENLAPNKGFSISCEFNNIIEIYHRLTLVAMVTKILDKFNTKLAIIWLV